MKKPKFVKQVEGTNIMEGITPDDITPSNRYGRRMQVLKSMKPGQFIKVDDVRVLNTYRQTAHRNNIKVTTRKNGDGYFLWRR